MRTIYVISFISLLLSCKTDFDDLVYRKIKLDYNLGTVKIALAPELDSFFTRTQHSDCNCCHKKIYGYVDSRYATDPHASYIGPLIPDSFRVFGISHVYDSACFEEEIAGVEELLRAEVMSLQKESPYTLILSDTVRIIRNRKFGILSYKNNDHEALKAFTIVKGQELHISFVQHKSSRKGFLKEMLRSLESIDVEK